jgi:hypothetical protein
MQQFLWVLVTATISLAFSIAVGGVDVVFDAGHAAGQATCHRAE